MAGQREQASPVIVSDPSDNTEKAKVINGRLQTDVITGPGGGDGAIQDGVDSGIEATVFDYTNSNPLSVRLSDTNGDYVSVGGGTQYTEGATSASFVGTMALGEAPSDTAKPLLLDNSQLLQVDIAADSVGIGGGTQYADGDAAATPTGTVALGHDGSNVRALTTDATGLLQVDLGTNNDVTVTSGNITVSATDLDIRDLTAASDSVEVHGDVGVLSQFDLTNSDPLTIAPVDTAGTQVPLQGSVLGDTDSNPTTLRVGAHLMGWTGSLWYRAGGSAGNGLEVDVTRVQGTVTVSATDLDIRDLSSATDSITVHGDVGALDQLDLTNSDPLAVAIVDGAGTQITSFGGGTQYADGDAAATPTGTVAMGHDGSNVWALTTDATGLLQVDLGANNDVTVTSGNITVSATDLDIRDLTSVSDSVEVLQGTASDLKTEIWGGAKGATAAAVNTVTAAGTDHNALDVVVRDSTGAELDLRQENENWNAADHGVLVFGRDIESVTNKYRALALNTEGDLYVDLSEINGVEPSVGNGTSDTGTLRVTLASDSTGTVAATQSGTWNITNVSGTVSLPTGASTLAEQQTQTTSLQIMDDWDETDRCKVNLIAGQAGITAGAGAVSTNTPRVTHASDDPVTTAVQLIDDAIFVDDADWTNDTSKHMNVGGVYQSSPITNVVTDGDVSPVQVNKLGSLRVAYPEDELASNTTHVKKYYTAATPTDGIVWSPAAGKRWYVTDIFIGVSAASTVTLEDDLTGGDSAVWKMELAANSGWSHSFNTPLYSGEDAADLIITATAGTVYVTVTGYEV